MLRRCVTVELKLSPQDQGLAELRPQTLAGGLYRIDESSIELRKGRPAAAYNCRGRATSYEARSRAKKKEKKSLPELLRRRPWRGSVEMGLCRAARAPLFPTCTIGDLTGRGPVAARPPWCRGPLMESTSPTADVEICKFVSFYLNGSRPDPGIGQRCGSQALGAKQKRKIRRTDMHNDQPAYLSSWYTDCRPVQRQDKRARLGYGPFLRFSVADPATSVATSDGQWARSWL